MPLKERYPLLEAAGRMEDVGDPADDLVRPSRVAENREAAVSS
jgi:hypothetical protein